MPGDPTRLRQVIVNLVGNAIKLPTSGGVPSAVAARKRGRRRDKRRRRTWRCCTLPSATPALGSRRNNSTRSSNACLHASRWPDHPAVRRHRVGSRDTSPAGEETVRWRFASGWKAKWVRGTTDSISSPVKLGADTSRPTETGPDPRPRRNGRGLRATQARPPARGRQPGESAAGHPAARERGHR